MAIIKNGDKDIGDYKDHMVYTLMDAFERGVLPQFSKTINRRFGLLGVDSISGRTIQRLFAEANYKSQQVKQYTGQVDWKDPAIVTAVHYLCTAYREAPALYEQGTIIACTDEKTGI